MSVRILLLAGASCLVAATAGTASAQTTDQPNWTGFYLGGIVGGAWGQTKAHATITTGNGTVVIPPADAALISRTSENDESKGGFTGGLEGGYNYQMGNWVFGGEVDWTTLDLKTTSHQTAQSGLLISPPITYTLDQKISTNWMVTLRPRVGYAFGPWLVYGTTGLAFSELKYNATLADNRSAADALTASSKSTKTGWVAGLGGAYAFTPNLSFKGEWLYADFGHVGSAQVNSFASVTPRDSVSTHMFRFGVDYKF